MKKGANVNIILPCRITPMARTKEADTQRSQLLMLVAV